MNKEIGIAKWQWRVEGGGEQGDGPGQPSKGESKEWNYKNN